MKAKCKMKCIGFLCLAVFVSFLKSTVAAQTSLPDVGLITNLSGEATYWNKADTPKPINLRVFMKVRLGDRLKLPAMGSLTLLYFAGGRQETWKGPVILMAGEHESKLLGGKQPAIKPEVKVLPVKASRQLEGAPLPLCPASMSKPGVIQTMGPKRELLPRAQLPLLERRSAKSMKPRRSIRT